MSTNIYHCNETGYRKTYFDLVQLLKEIVPDKIIKHRSLNYCNFFRESVELENFIQETVLKSDLIERI